MNPETDVADHPLTPIVFAAANAQHQQVLSPGFALWSADIKAFRLGHFCTVSERVLFIESQDRVILCGLEFPDGFTDVVEDARASAQQRFIQFIRGETRKNLEAMGPGASQFFGAEFLSEAMVTAAYITLRAQPLGMIVGHHTADADHDYQWIYIPHEENEFMAHARFVLPFGELGRLNA